MRIQGSSSYLVSRNKVPDKEEYGHDDMLGNRNDVRASDFENLDALRYRGVEINVIRADTGRYTDLEVFCL